MNDENRPQVMNTQHIELSDQFHQFCLNKSEGLVIYCKDREEQMQIRSALVIYKFVWVFGCFRRWERTHGRGGMKRDGIDLVFRRYGEKYIYASFANTEIQMFK